MPPNREKPYSIVTKDGIQVNNIPADMPEDSPQLKQRVAEIRAERGMPALEPVVDAPVVDAPVAEEPRFLDKVAGVGRAADTVLSSIPAESIGGATGALTLLGTAGDADAAVGVLNRVRDALTIDPTVVDPNAPATSTYAVENLKSLAKTIKPLTDIIEAAEKASGDIGFDIAGPIGGAIGAALPTALAEALGIIGTMTAKRVAGTLVDDAAAGVIEAGERLDVPVLTTDVQPPTTFAGKHVQQLSEKLGPLGTGPKRADQQRARQNVVEELAKEFEIELDSPFAEEIVASLNAKSAKTLETAAIQRNAAVDALVPFGVVPVTRTVAAIDAQLARQARLGDKADKALVTNLENIKNSLDGDFALVKDIRTEVIDDLKALARSEDRRAEGSLQAVKSAMDKDLVDFARTHDKNAAGDWLRSNRVFAEEFSRTRNTELKRILNAGEATPEKVIPILKGGKRSELDRLNESLTPKGRASARAAIIRDALDESGFFRGDLNPDRLATALNKTNRRQAIDVFFTGQDKKQLDGLTRLLDATRRAQQSSAAPATGVQAVPFLAGGAVATGAAVTDTVTTLGTVGALSAIAKAYESKPFRTLLLKIANSKPGSKIETGLLDATVPGVLAGLQAAKAQQEQTEALQ
jgi:hypothetical protein